MSQTPKQQYADWDSVRRFVAAHSELGTPSNRAITAAVYRLAPSIDRPSYIPSPFPGNRRTLVGTPRVRWLYRLYRWGQCSVAEARTRLQKAGLWDRQSAANLLPTLEI